MIAASGRHKAHYRRRFRRGRRLLPRHASDFLGLPDEDGRGKSKPSSGIEGNYHEAPKSPLHSTEARGNLDGGWSEIRRRGGTIHKQWGTVARAVVLVPLGC